MAHQAVDVDVRLPELCASGVSCLRMAQLFNCQRPEGVLSELAGNVHPLCADVAPRLGGDVEEDRPPAAGSARRAVSLQWSAACVWLLPTQAHLYHISKCSGQRCHEL